MAARLCSSVFQKSLAERVSIWVIEVLPAPLAADARCPAPPLPEVAICVLVATVPRMSRLRLT